MGSINRGKGFPYKEAKKLKTAKKLDRRPHVSINMPHYMVTKNNISTRLKTGIPSPICTLTNENAYSNLETKTHEFCSVKLTGDVLKLVCNIAWSPYDHLLPNLGLHDISKEFCIADPSIDMVEEFAKQAYKYTISRHYSFSAREKG